MPLRDRLRERREQRAQNRADAAVETTPAPNPDRAAIEETVASLARAFESRNLSRVRQVYSGITMEQAQEWGDFFLNARNLRVRLRIATLDPSGDEASASLEGGYEYDDLETGRGVRRPVSFSALFRREGTSWRLTSLR